MKNTAAVVLAAGKGTRLSYGEPSPRPKVLYKLAGRPMISYTLGILKKLGIDEIIVVVGHRAEEVKKVVGEGVKFAVQKKRLGTAHAASAGLSLVSDKFANVLVVNGDDSAFYKPGTIQKVLNKHVGKGNTVTFVTVELPNPTGFGRIIRKDKKPVRIIEEKVATAKQKKIKEVNDGVYIFRRGWFEKNLHKLEKSPVGEYYLTDTIELAATSGEKVDSYKLGDPSEWCGVNTPEELNAADARMRERLKDAG